MQMNAFVILTFLAYSSFAAAAAADHDKIETARKLLGLFDGLKAVHKVAESHVGNGMKAGQKITKSVQKQVKDVVRADAKMGRAIYKATDKAINAGEKAVVIGIGEKLSGLNNIITAPLVGPNKSHHSGHGSSAAKEAIKTIKAVEQGKQKAAKAIEKAAEERQHAIKKVTKQLSSTIDHTHKANNRAINKALLGRP